VLSKFGVSSIDSILPEYLKTLTVHLVSIKSLGYSANKRIAALVGRSFHKLSFLASQTL